MQLRPTNHCYLPDLLDLVPSLYVEIVTKNSSKSVPPFSDTVYKAEMKGNILFKSVLLLNVNKIQEYSCLI